MKETIKHIIGFVKCVLNGIAYHKNIYIGRRCQIIRGKNIIIEDNVQIRPYSFISCNKDGIIKIGKNTDIGNRFRCVAAKKIIIGNSVLFGPNVYIADQDHDYKNINLPIKDSGVSIAERGIEIGDESWIGINSVIVGNVNIGKHCTIGANSVVTKDIPDYCVAVGSPAKIIKKYKFELNEWEKVNGK